MKKYKTYRNIYTKQYGLELPKDYEIHHIDQNRNNNNIINLIAIPKRLHRDYHNLIQSNLHLIDFKFSFNVNTSVQTIDIDSEFLSFLNDLFILKKIIFNFVKSRDDHLIKTLPITKFLALVEENRRKNNEI